MLSVKESWQDILQWFGEHQPEALAALNPGAILSDFSTLEKHFPQLPSDFYELYSLNNGQNYSSEPGLFLGMQMLPLEEVCRDYENWRLILEQSPEINDNLDSEQSWKSYPSGWVKTEYINVGRIPLTSDGGGNHIGIDLDPGPLGKVGQVINFGRDEEHKCVIAPSLAEFLAFMLECYRDGRVMLEDRQVVWTQPRLEHFLDALHFIFKTERNWTFADIE